MIYNMYEPEGKSKAYLYIFFFSAVLVLAGIVVYTRPLVVQSACSDMSLKMTGLSRNYDFNLDPNSSYDYLKAKCLSDTLSSTK